MPQMTGAEAVVEMLRREGVSMVFGIPGVHALGIYNVLVDCPDIEHINVRHEQAAGFMADAYARATRGIGVALVTPGPGAGNSITAMGESYASSTPVLYLIPQIKSTLVDSGKGSIHEYKDHFNMIKSVTRWCARVKTPEEIPAALAAALRVLKTERPGPVAVEMPMDLIAAKANMEFPSSPDAAKKNADVGQIKQAAELLAQAGRPAIFVGGGCVRAGADDEVRELAELLQAPVVSTFMGKGVLPEDHPLSLGCINGMNPFRGAPTKGPFYDRLWSQVDVLLAVGMKFSEAATDGWRLPVCDTLVQIDIDAAELGKNYPATVGIEADAKLALSALIEQVQAGLAQSRPSRAAELAEVREEVRRLILERSPQELEVLDGLRSLLPRDAVVANDMTIMTYWSGRYFPVYEPSTFLYPYGSTTLGYGLPAAIAAKLARPESKVVGLLGDGGFMWTCQEVATAVKYRVSVPIVIFNDSCYGVLKSFQEGRFGRSFEVDLTNPDFVDFAKAFKARGVRVRSLDELKAALEEAFDAGTITLIDMPLKPNPPWLSYQS